MLVFQRITKSHNFLQNCHGQREGEDSDQENRVFAGPKCLFHERRKGLFKKAAELGCLIPEVRIAAVVFSPAGNPYVFGDVSEMEKLLAMEESRNELLTSEETEKGEEENTGSDPVVEISTALNTSDSTPQEITESGDMASNPSIVNDFTMKEVTKNKNARFCVQDTTFASSSHCLEMPIVDSDFLAADFDGFDEEGVFFISTYLGFCLLLLLLQPFAKLELLETEMDTYCLLHRVDLLLLCRSDVHFSLVLAWLQLREQVPS
nr:MADS-box transcription factor 23-like [Ipomoea batatas]